MIMKKEDKIHVLTKMIQFLERVRNNYIMDLKYGRRDLTEEEKRIWEEKQVVERIFNEVPTAVRVYVRKHAYYVVCPEYIANLFDIVSETLTTEITAQCRWMNCIICGSEEEDKVKAGKEDCYERNESEGF